MTFSTPLRALDDDADPKIVDVLVHRLRRKIPNDIRIESVWGIGYRMVSQG